VQNQLELQWESLMGNHPTPLPDLFMHGIWADYRDIAILNTDTSGPTITQEKVNEWYYNILVATIVNSAWTQQNVYIACYPMTQDQCL
jgi:hypothetical protein